MACERYKSRLIEEALVPGGDSELAVHLSGCADCRDEVARQRELQNRIDGSIAAMVAVQPSPVLLARVRQQIDAEESPRRAAWMQWTIGGIATAALAGFAIWFAGRALLRQSISGPQPAQAAVGTPNLPTSAQNQPAPSPGNPATSTAPPPSPAGAGPRCAPPPGERSGVRCGTTRSTPTATPT